MIYSEYEDYSKLAYKNIEFVMSNFTEPNFGKSNSTNSETLDDWNFVFRIL